MSGSRNQWIAVGIIVTILVGALAAGLALSEDLFPVEVGSNAPDFRAINLATEDSVSLADYEGEVVLLNLWATWCAPCRQEMPAMQRLHEQLGSRGLRVVAVSTDQGRREDVVAFADELELTFDILHDRSQRVELLYQTTGLPESFVIDRHGVIVKKEIGAVEWDSPARIALMQRLLESESGADRPQD